jgi:hypothetical protein
MVSKKVQRKAQEKIARLQKKMGPDWKPSESLAARAGGVHLTTVSKRKAEEMGLSETERHLMSPKEYKKAEKGQVDLGKPTAREVRQQTEADRITKLNEEIASKKEPTVRPTIKLTPKKEDKTGLAAYREKKTIGGYAAKVMTSPVTTAVLAGVALTGLAAIGGGTAAAGTAIITRTAFKGGASLTTQRAFIGKSAASGVDKIFHTVRPIAARYAANPKSHTLTKGVFSKLGLSIGAAGIAVGAIGSYPFAGFIKEEAVQTLNIPIMSALHNDDIEGAKLQVAAIDEILNNKDSIMSKIPYLNVLSSLSGFFKAAEVSNNEWKRIIGEIETHGSFAEKKKEEGVQERQESAEYYAGVEEERRQRDLEEMEWKAEYYALIREGKYEEAEELLQTQMKGGG